MGGILYTLLRCDENCKEALDYKINIRGAFMDLSEAFNHLNLETLTAKLEGYGFSKAAFNFKYSYLNDRKQRVKVNGSYGNGRNINNGVPHGSVLGSLLLNVYLNDLFMVVVNNRICN